MTLDRPLFASHKLQLRTCEPDELSNEEVIASSEEKLPVSTGPKQIRNEINGGSLNGEQSSRPATWVVDGLVWIYNNSTRAVDLMVKANETLVSVPAGTTMDIQLPDGIRVFCLRNVWSDNRTNDLVFNDNHSKLTVSNESDNSSVLVLRSKKGSVIRSF